MSEVDDVDIDPDATAAEVAIDARSMLQQFRQNRDERDDTKKFMIPTWEGDLLAEYQVLDPADVQKMIRRARQRASGRGPATGPNMEADANFLVRACVGVWGCDPESGDEIKVSDGYTMELASMLDPRYPKGHPQAGEPVSIKTPEELVVYMIKWKGLILAAHGQDVGRWMQNPTKFNLEDPQ